MVRVAAGCLIAAGTVFGSNPAVAADRYQKPSDVIRVESGLESYYSEYNFSRTRDESGLDSGSGYYLFSVPVTIEGRHYLSEAFYLAPYGRVALTYDFGTRPWNRSYWNNNQIFSGGVKLTTEHSFMNTAEEYVGGVSASLFSEYQLMTSSFDSSKDPLPDGIAQQNVKSGLSFWFSHERPIGRGFSIWTESWGELAWNTTAFSDRGEDDFLLGTLSSKVGAGVDVGKASFKPYFTVDLVNDFLDKDWNRVSWFNNVQYGPGIRIQLGRYLPGNVDLYAEYLFVSYFDTPQNLDHDVKAGIACWFPIF
ncbi:hypothetical protein [Chlorobium sp. N1]|uniref:hypothetical protein n=1 Tax=Chlorobium sp. N1 TaxID=2491138 RepID=UPI001F604D21|nr:hypothetical protein [Chlorobium sp. N1]